MEYTKLLERINWRLIVIHFIATFFFVSAAYQLSILNDWKYIEAVNTYGLELGIKKYMSQDNYPFVYYLIWIKLAPVIGLLTAFLFSLFLTIRMKILWINSLIAFLLAFIFNKIGAFQNDIIDYIFYPGNSFVQYGIQYKFIVNGVILLSIGLLLFLSKWSKRFILKSTHKSSNSLPSAHE